MRMRLRTAALLTMAGALTAGTVTPAFAATASGTIWSADLAAGESSGVDVASGSARLDPARAFLAPLDDGGATEGGASVPTGLLTLPPRRLPAVTDHVATAVTGDVPAGTTASVDVRGMRDNGNWTEWIPAAPGAGGPVAALPEPTSQVQARLVLTGGSGAIPAVRAVSLTAQPVDRARLSEGKPNTEGAPLNFSVFATREGLAGGTTANGHVIADRDHFVALPSRRALSPRDTSDYSVKVCAPNGKCAFAPVWDVGPWNTHDDYWNPSPQREQWGDLPQGVPQAQAAFRNGYNGGNDQYDRKVANPAGIDLGDGLFWDALGLTNNSTVSVDYLWTGNVRLSKVVGNNPVDVLAAPDAAADVVGLAAEDAAVPVECATSVGGDKWLRIGVGQYVHAEAVPDAGPVGTCPAPAEPATPASSKTAPAAPTAAAAPKAGPPTPEPGPTAVAAAAAALAATTAGTTPAAPAAAVAATPAATPTATAPATPAATTAPATPDPETPAG